MLIQCYLFCVAGVDVAAKSNITVNNQENGNGMHAETTKQNGEHQKHEMSYINSKAETTDIEEIIDGDGDDEIAEYDVETVIRKQDTHDLFCPNCNSCITKRVILRKRKRRTRIPGEEAKRSKPVSTESNAVLDDSSDNRALNGVDSRLDDVQPPTSDEYDHQREPDVFRCLSCFSIFMPTGINIFSFSSFLVSMFYMICLMMQEMVLSCFGCSEIQTMNNLKMKYL